MILVNEEVKPCNVKLVKRGTCTQWGVSQTHIDKRNCFHKDGFINVLAKGKDYDYIEGDSIMLTQINGVDLMEYKGKKYFTVYADVVVIKPGHNADIVQDDIPDDLLE